MGGSCYRARIESAAGDDLKEGGIGMSQHPGPNFTYLGQARIPCEPPGGETVLTDPGVQNNPACPKELKELERVDAMLITHAHGDHMGDAVEIAKKHRPKTVVANYEICNWLTQ